MHRRRGGVEGEREGWDSNRILPPSERARVRERWRRWAVTWARGGVGVGEAGKATAWAVLRWLPANWSRKKIDRWAPPVGAPREERRRLGPAQQEGGQAWERIGRRPIKKKEEKKGKEKGK